MKELTEIEITKEDFQEYEDVRQSGVTNMFMLSTVQYLTGLSKKQLIYIMQNYTELCKKYPDVRSL